MAWAIAAQWLRVFSGGPGQPLGWASWVQPGSGVPGPKRNGEDKEAALPWGLSTDELKSKEDPFGGTVLVGATPLRVGLEEGCFHAGCHGEREGEPQPPAQTPAQPEHSKPSQARPSQGRLSLTPLLRARLLNAPALTQRPLGARGQRSACWAGLECVIILAGWGQWSSWQWGA